MEWFEFLIIITVVAFVLTVFIIHIKNEIKSAKRVMKTGQCCYKGCSSCSSMCHKK